MRTRSSDIWIGWWVWGRKADNSDDAPARRYNKNDAPTTYLRVLAIILCLFSGTQT